MRGATTIACGQRRMRADAHRRADAERLGLVAGGEHDPAADDHRPTAETGVVTLLDRREERVEIGVQDRRLHEHMFAQVSPRRGSSPVPRAGSRRGRRSCSRRDGRSRGSRRASSRCRRRGRRSRAGARPQAADVVDDLLPLRRPCSLRPARRRSPRTCLPEREVARPSARARRRRRGRAEPGTEPKEERPAALVAAEGLHGGVVDDLDGLPMAASKSKPTQPGARLTGSVLTRLSSTGAGIPIEATSNGQSVVSAATPATICSGVRSGPGLESPPLAAIGEREAA